MRLLRGAAKVIGGTVFTNVDLVLVWWATLIAQALVPTGHMLARNDLVPWIALTLSVCALLRVRPVGEGPHPMLATRRSTFDARMRALAAALVPWVLAFVHDAVAFDHLQAGGWAAGGAFVVALLLRLARRDADTAWNPPGVPSALLWLVLAFTLAGMAVIAGALTRLLADVPLVASGGVALLGGTSFFAVSAVAGRPKNLRQRRAAGITNDESWWPDLFRPTLTFAGPAMGYLILVVLYDLLGEGVDFRFAFVGALHVVSWTAVLWGRPSPAAVQCMLHEVVATGGRDAPVEEAAFDRPPEGALRINALDIRRTRNVHPWLVPVQQARIESHDDPVRPLWPRPPPPLSLHVLGDASFELDEDTGGVQTEQITVHLRGQADTTALREGEVQSRRLVVMRAWPSWKESWRRRRVTYLWEERLPAASMQIVDTATETVTLRNGSIIVLSTEGVIRAYEVEIGAEVPTLPDGGIVRAPQLEDYEGVG
jgi:hypothetical protein